MNQSTNKESSRPREKRRRRRRQSRPKSKVVLRAVLTVRSCVAGEGLLLYHGPIFGESRYPAAAGVAAHPLQISGLAPGRPYRLSRRCANFNVDGYDYDFESTGPAGAAGAAVHTLLIDNYDSYTYNLFQLLAVVNGQAPFVVYNDDDGGDLW